MGVKIQFRRDTAADWTTANPVLHQGELGIETDTGHAKMGDGSTAWSSLLYWSPDPYMLALAGGSMTGWLSPSVVDLTDAATILVDASKGNDFRVTIAASRTMAAPTNPRDGQKIIFEITQGAGGSFGITWSAGYSFGALTAPSLSTQPGDADQVGFRYSSAKGSWLYTGSSLGF
jgi:Major tropism determinant N-terminal domain